MKFEELLLSAKYKKPRTYVLYGIGGLVVYFFVRGLIKKIRLNITERKSGEDENVQYAIVLKMAMNPSGSRWMRSFDGTNRNEIFNTAMKIDNMTKVARAYKSLYGSSVYQDLQKELNITDYNKFIAILEEPRSVEILLTEGMSADDIHTLALELFDDLDGFTIIRKYSLYADILKLTDNNFIALNNHYNELYLDSTGKTLRLTIKREILFEPVMLSQWKSLMLKRFEQLRLN